jgi:hypothetical protein
VRTLLAIVAAFFVLGLVGCGGPPREARVAVEQTAGGLNLADELVAEAVESRGEEKRAQVRAEVRAGRFDEQCALHEDGSDAYRTCLIEAGLDRFEELMEPTTTARTVLRTAGEALEAVELGLDAWAAGTDEGGSFIEAIACSIGSVAAVGRALEAADLEIPEALATGLQAIAGFASGACPEPEGG